MSVAEDIRRRFEQGSDHGVEPVYPSVEVEIALAMLEVQERQAAALERIADALATLTIPPSEPSGQECPHPIEQRIDFGVTGGVEDWQCRACGYRTTAEVG